MQPIKAILSKDSPIFVKKTGKDIVLGLKHTILLKENKASIFHCKLKLYLPLGYFGILRERGVFSRLGIQVAGGEYLTPNGPEVVIFINNTSTAKHIILKNTPLAQFFLVPFQLPN